MTPSNVNVVACNGEASSGNYHQPCSRFLILSSNNDNILYTFLSSACCDVLLLPSGQRQINVALRLAEPDKPCTPVLPK